MTRPDMSPRPGDQRVGIVEGWELRHARKQDANSGAWKGFAFVAGVIALLLVGGWFAARPIIGPAMTDLFQENYGIVKLPIVSDLLFAELSDRLSAPASSSNEEIEFVLETGEDIDVIAENLQDQGLLTDPVAFKYAMVVDRIDELMLPGIYTMTPTITPEGIADRFAEGPDPPPARTVLDMRHGRRIEQIVAYLQKVKDDLANDPKQPLDFELDPKEFLELARNPGPELRDEYDFLRQAPRGASLEGFLAGGTYEVDVDITADELIRLMLEQWDEDAGDLVTQARKKGVDFYQALIIASLVEREAKVDGDRAKIAGVYWNRLDPKVNKQTAGLMQADPTVVYATDTMALDDLGIKKWPTYLFWDTLGVADLASVDVDARLQSFQTYQQAGLPEWPIATPTRKSIRAALEPNTKKNKLYFYACPGSDKHKFANTAAKHAKNIANCG